MELTTQEKSPHPRIRYARYAIIAVIGILAGLVFGYLAWGNNYDASDMGRGVGQNKHDMRNAKGDDSMQGTMIHMLGRLEGKAGDAFDKAFIDEMIIHHQGAIDMANAALISAGHKEIKDLARVIITAQTTEINQMKAWRAAWFGTSGAQSTQ